VTDQLDSNRNCLNIHEAITFFCIENDCAMRFGDLIAGNASDGEAVAIIYDAAAREIARRGVKDARKIKNRPILWWAGERIEA